MRNHYFQQRTPNIDPMALNLVVAIVTLYWYCINKVFYM